MSTALTRDDGATPRLFEMLRHRDVSGISGEGKVADLTAYPNGKVTVAWCSSDVHSVGIYDSLEQVLRIHGHDGATQLVQIFPTDEVGTCVSLGPGANERRATV